jgi:hypothetical protein
MIVADQSGRLRTGANSSPLRSLPDGLRQAGFLCLLVLYLSTFVIVWVHARDIGESTVLSSGRIMSNGQDESRVVGIAPNVSVPDAPENERNVLWNQDPGFNCFASRIVGRDGVLPARMVPIDRKCALQTDLARQSSLDIKGRHECGSLPVVLNVQMENSRGLIEITAASHVRAIDLPGGFFPANYELVGDVGQQSGGDRGNQHTITIQNRHDLPDRTEEKIVIGALFCCALAYLYLCWKSQ